MVSETASLVASRIDTSRKEAGVSELSLSEQTGIPYTTLRRKLRGRGKPFDIPETVRIGRALSVDFVTWLRDIPEDAA